LKRFLRREIGRDVARETCLRLMTEIEEIGGGEGRSHELGRAEMKDQMGRSKNEGKKEEGEEETTRLTSARSRSSSATALSLFSFRSRTFSV